MVRTPVVLGVPTAAAMQTAFAYLGAECCLFMEIAMHELTVLPSGDLTAVDRKQMLSAVLLRREPSTWARQAGQSKLPLISRPLSLCLPHHPRAENRRGPSACRGWGHRLTCP